MHILLVLKKGRTFNEAKSVRGQTIIVEFLCFSYSKTNGISIKDLMDVLFRVVQNDVHPQATPISATAKCHGNFQKRYHCSWCMRLLTMKLFTLTIDFYLKIGSQLNPTHPCIFEIT